MQLRKEEAITTRLLPPPPRHFDSRNLYLVVSDREECEALDKDGGELFPDPLGIFERAKRCGVVRVVGIMETLSLSEYRGRIYTRQSNVFLLKKNKILTLYARVCI